MIESCLRNDKAAQKLLYDRFAPKMYAVCLRYASKRVEADDILQESFIKIFHHLPHFRFDGSFEGWIRKIVARVAIDHIQKYASRWEELDEYTSEDYSIVPDEAISNLSVQELQSMIQELPEGKRMVFNLYAFEGYSHKEIAEMLGISVMTSKAQYSKAKKMLQDKLLNVNKMRYEYK